MVTDLTAGQIFREPDSGDYRLKPTPVTSAAADGGKPGADIEAIARARGVVESVEVATVGDTQAVLRYVAPDNVACTVRVSEQGAASGSMRVGDGGGERRRTVVVDGLRPATPYEYHVLCASEQPSGSFSTTAPVDAEVPTMLTLKPPDGFAARALIEYGPNAALGSATESTSCENGCTLKMQWRQGRVLYYRVKYLQADGSAASTGRVEVLVP